jgi:hypothetical protein
MHNENKVEVVACVVPPQFVFSSLLNILPCLNAFLQTPFKNPINKNNQCKKQIATTNIRT